MIVDPSAIMAILLEEAEHDSFSHLLITSSSSKLSAGGWVELSTVLTRSGRPALFPLLDALMATFAIRVEPATEEQARMAHMAYRTFGMGTGHPAKLNFGDCFSYALAKETGEPLLFKGDDFKQTDIGSAT